MDNQISTEVLHIANEFVYNRFLMDRNQMRHFFREINLTEYIILLEAENERIYLVDLAEKMQMPLRIAGRFVGGLQDKGLIVWSHDGRGEEGTHVTITPEGIEKLRAQEEVLKKVYGQVLDQFGKDEMLSVLSQTKRIGDLLRAAGEQMEDSEDGEEEE